ncbi:MAG: HAD family phosphatase [Planctomycetes bacterium]|nr:HAD family phosphatase [Planctomycetota bacterium]
MHTAAVIFDMDGVLVDSYQAHFASWRRVYGDLGIDYGEVAFAADFGRTSRDILRRTLGDALTEERIRELDGFKEAYFRDILRESFPAMDGAVELIDSLVADGFRIAVGSSGPPENIALSLEKLGRTERFSAIVTGADVTRGKPDPQVFQLAAERLGVPPALCVVVEDAVHGIEAARRAGMKGVALTGTTTRDQLAHADLIVDSLRQIMPAKLRALIGAPPSG